MRFHIGIFIIIIILVGSYFIYRSTQDFELEATINLNSSKLISNLSDFSLIIQNNAFIYDSFLKSFRIFTIPFEKNLFSTNSNQGFLSCLIGNTYTVNNFGAWYFNDKNLLNCNKQTLTSIENIENSIILKGSFEDCPQVQYLYKIIINPTPSHNLRIEAQCIGSEINRAMIEFNSVISERIFGFGEQSSKINMKGSTFSNWARERGVFRDNSIINNLLNIFYHNSGGKWYYTYFPSPVFISSFLRSFYLINDGYNIFDLHMPDSIRLMVWSKNLSFYVFESDSYKNLLIKLTDLTGRMRALPEWSMKGAIVAITGGSDRIKNALKNLENYNTSLSGIWTQDWSGRRLDGKFWRLWWNWQLDLNLYPDWDQMTDILEKKGIRRLTYINPMLHNISGKIQGVRNFYEEAFKNQYLIVKNDGSPAEFNLNGCEAGLIDWTNPEAKNFYKDIIKNEMINKSKTWGFMADFGEDPDIKNVLFYNMTLSNDEIHNNYVYGLQEAISEVCEETNDSNILYFARSGNKLSPKNSRLIWTGDHLQNWGSENGLKSALISMLGLGLSGIPFSHSDIGGYIAFDFYEIFKEKRTEELLKRWIEMEAFGLIMRTHEGTLPLEVPQVYDLNIVDFFGKFSRIYTLLKDYRISLMKEAEETGYPVIRHLLLEYSHDENVFDLNQQYLLGNDFLVGPVLDPGMDYKLIYFPLEKNGEQEKWVNIWDDNYIINGCACWTKVKATLGLPAVFYRQKSKWGKTFADNLKK